MSEFVKLGKTLEKANIAAVNRAAKTAVSQASSFIREKYNFKKRDLDLLIRISFKATNEYPYVKVRIVSGGIPLTWFNPKQFGLPGRRSKKKGPRFKEGVKATVIKGKRQLFRSADRMRGSFIWSGDTEEDLERGVFIRTGKKKIMKKGKFKGKERESIVKLYGVDLGKLFDPKTGESYVIKRMHEVFDQEYQKRLEHEIKYRLSNEK